MAGPFHDDIGRDAHGEGVADGKDHRESDGIALMAFSMYFRGFSLI